MNLRQLLPALVALVFLGVGIGVGAVLLGDGDDEAPTTTRVITAGEVPEPCQQALQLATEAINASAQAIAVAQAAASGPAGSPSTPSADVVAQAAGQAQALRQQYGTVRSACEAAQGVMGSSTTITSSAPVP